LFTAVKPFIIFGEIQVCTDMKNIVLKGIVASKLQTSQLGEDYGNHLAERFALLYSYKFCV
jgi:hypothetical protein